MDKVEGSLHSLTKYILNAKSASELKRPYLTICTARKGLMTSLFMGVVVPSQMSFPLAVLLLDRHFAKSPPFASISFFPAVYSVSWSQKMWMNSLKGLFIWFRQIFRGFQQKLRSQKSLWQFSCYTGGNVSHILISSTIIGWGGLTKYTVMIA